MLLRLCEFQYRILPEFETINGYRHKSKMEIFLYLSFFVQVTADIHAIRATCLQIEVSLFSLGGILRAIVGPLPFWAVFLLVEMLKLSVFFSIGLGNVSSFLQTTLVMDWR